MHLELIFLLALILTLTLVVWQPVVVPRYNLDSHPPLGLSWCRAAGARVGLQLILPLVPWQRCWWCARASAAIDGEGICLRLHVWRRPRRPL